MLLVFQSMANHAPVDCHICGSTWTEQTRFNGWKIHYCYFTKLKQFLTISLCFIHPDKYRSQFLPKKLPSATDKNYWRDPQMFKIQRMSDFWVPNLNWDIYNATLHLKLRVIHERGSRMTVRTRALAAWYPVLDMLHLWNLNNTFA